MIPEGCLLGIMGKTQKLTLGFTTIESLQERNLPFSKSPFLSCARRSLDTLEKSEELIPFLESPADQPVRKLSDYFLQLTSLRERERERETAQLAGSVHKRSTGVYLRAQFPWMK
jgi:hypothetical protein